MADDLDILRKGFEEFAHWLNPLIAERARLSGVPLEIVRVADGVMFDAAGKAYEDFYGAQGLGHRPAQVVAALREALESDLPTWFPSRVAPHAGRLGKRLCSRTGYERAYFSCTGSDAVEAALKLARAATRRAGVLCLDGAYHGRGMGSMALMAAGPLHDPFAPHLPGVRRLPFGDVDALDAALSAEIGAVVVEPIQGEGGIRPLPDDYVTALCELTAERGALLIADEVQTGLGRTGCLLRSGAWPRRPDAVCLGKHLGAGLMLGIKLKQVDHPWLSLEHFGLSRLAARGRSSIAPLLCQRLHRHGFCCAPAGHDWRVVRVQPRLTIDSTTLQRFTQACATELAYLAELA